MEGCCSDFRLGMLALLTATISCMERACVASILYAGLLDLEFKLFISIFKRARIPFYGEVKIYEDANSSTPNLVPAVESAAMEC